MAWSPIRTVLREISPSPFTTTRGVTPLASRVDSQSNVVLIPESFLTPSPEEQIIRQRSRRYTIQPQVLVFDDIENEETPSKFGLPLSSHTRKRLLLTPPKDSSSPNKGEKCGPRAKKSRLHRRHSDVPLRTQLPAYSADQLVEMLDRLVTTHPELEKEVRSNMTTPDLRPLQENLRQLHRNILRALPTTRWTSSRDTCCYRRVKIHLDMFKKACVDQGRMLVNAQCWESSVRYVTSAWRVVYQLPTWDEPAHNDHKHRCFQALASQCMTALKNSCLEKDVYRELRTKLQPCRLLSREIAPCLHHLEVLLNTDTPHDQEQ